MNPMKKRHFLKTLLSLIAVPVVLPEKRLTMRKLIQVKSEMLERNLKARDEGLHTLTLGNLPPYTYWSKSAPCLENPTGWTWRDCSQWPVVVKHWNGLEWVAVNT